MTGPDAHAPPPDYLTPVIYHTLLSLFEGPKHGYAISREATERTDGRVRMGPGTLYGTLQRLGEKGWLEETDEPEGEGPHADRRRYYRITPSGVRVLKAEAARLDAAVRHARDRAVLEGS